MPGILLCGLEGDCHFLATVCPNGLGFQDVGFKALGLLVATDRVHDISGLMRGVDLGCI